MKTDILSRLAACLTAVGVLAGCIHETFPMGSTQREDQVMMSDLAIEGLVNGIPSSMMKYNTAGYYSSYGIHIDFGIPAIHVMTESMLEDLAVIGDMYSFQFYMYLYNQGQGDDEWPVAYFWDCYYLWIKQANQIISLIDPDTASDDAVGYLGQAYAYRAMCYLDLARLYEAKEVTGVPDYEVPASILGLTVPIVDENTTERESMNNPRVSREKLYEFIFTDLQKALTYLEGRSYDFSKPSVAAVYGMYARAYLEQGYWKEGGDTEAFGNAARYARMAIEASGRIPLTQAQWTDPSSGFNSGSSNNAWIWGLRVSSEQLINLIQFNAHMSPESLWGYAPTSQPGISKRLYDEITDGDFRKLSWLDPDWTGIGGGSEIDYSFAGSESDQQTFIEGDLDQGGYVYPAAAYESIKFRPVSGEMNDYVTGGPADHPLMRVEEMYFIEMEAEAHSDLPGAAALLDDFMNDYRMTGGKTYSCSANAGTLDGFLSEMMLQKRIEFWGEGILFYDYKRLDMGITRNYQDSNHPSVWQFNTPHRSPQWNIVISSVGEMQSNSGITQATNNPDPSGVLVVEN